MSHAAPNDPAPLVIKCKEWTLVKYDGDMPEGGLDGDVDTLKADPRVQEILRGGDDIPTVCLYRRPENASD